MMNYKLAAGELRLDDQYRVSGFGSWRPLSEHPLCSQTTTCSERSEMPAGRSRSAAINGAFALIVDMPVAIGFVGSILIFLGVFAPAATVPLLGSVNHLQQGRPAGVLLIALALISLCSVAARSFRWLWVTGCVATLAVAASFIALKYELAQFRTGASTQRDKIFAQVGVAFADAVQVDWGFAVLLIGAAALLIAAAAGTGKLQFRAVAAASGRPMALGSHLAGD